MVIPAHSAPAQQCLRGNGARGASSSFPGLRFRVLWRRRAGGPFQDWFLKQLLTALAKPHSLAHVKAAAFPAYLALPAPSPSHRWWGLWRFALGPVTCVLLSQGSCIFHRGRREAVSLLSSYPQEKSPAPETPAHTLSSLI